MYEYVVYRSFATDPRDVSPHVMDILKQSSRNNRRDSVTGFLHLECGRFYQHLEGAKLAVDGLMSRLSIDPRHSGIEVLRRGVLSARLFNDWDLGFASADQNYLSSMSKDPNRSPLNVDEIIAFLLDASKRCKEAHTVALQA